MPPAIEGRRTLSSLKFRPLGRFRLASHRRPPSRRRPHHPPLLCLPCHRAWASKLRKQCLTSTRVVEVCHNFGFPLVSTHFQRSAKQVQAFQFCQDGGKNFFGMSNLAQIQGRGKGREEKHEFLSIRIALTSPAGKTDVCMSFLVFSHTSHRAMCRTRPRVMRRRESIGALSKPLHNQSPDEEDTRCNDTRPIGADSSRSFVISTVSTSTWSVNIHEGGEVKISMN